MRGIKIALGIALVVALIAAGPSITGENVVDESLTGADVLNNSLSLADVDSLGYLRVTSAPVPITWPSTDEATAACPTGLQPLGGGHEFVPVSAANYGAVMVRMSAPAPNSRTQAVGWFVMVEPLSADADGLSVRAFVICAGL